MTDKRTGDRHGEFLSIAICVGIAVGSLMAHFLGRDALLGAEIGAMVVAIMPNPWGIRDGE